MGVDAVRESLGNMLEQCSECTESLGRLFRRNGDTGVQGADVKHVVGVACKVLGIISLVFALGVVLWFLSVLVWKVATIIILLIVGYDCLVHGESIYKDFEGESQGNIWFPWDNTNTILGSLLRRAVDFFRPTEQDGGTRE